MEHEYLVIRSTGSLHGQARLIGAKNAVLVIMASLILTDGISVLTNVPDSDDVRQMIALLHDLGAQVIFDVHKHRLTVDTRMLCKYEVKHEIMKKMRASILVMGPLLARAGKARVAVPGGCVIGVRPINYHFENFAKMGVCFEHEGDTIYAHARLLEPAKLVLPYPSVGATENVIMLATRTPGVTHIINAALEPEVMDLIAVLRKMGARIQTQAPASIEIEGVETLYPVEHTVLADRLEAGALLLAAAMTGGEVYLPDARADTLDLFLLKLKEMGHTIETSAHEVGVWIGATPTPHAVSFKTAPYPGFPTDLQAPMMAAQCIAQGTSTIEEGVFENRLLHVKELQKMGAQIEQKHNKAIVTGVSALQAASVTATDIRASCALVLAGMVAQGTTIMTGIHHFRRGYEALEKKLQKLGADIATYDDNATVSHEQSIISQKNTECTWKAGKE